MEWCDRKTLVSSAKTMNFKQDDIGTDVSYEDANAYGNTI